MVLVQNKNKNTLVGVLRTKITFFMHSSPSCYVTLCTQGTVSQKILRLRYTLRGSSSSWKYTTSAIVSQQTIVTTTFNHTQSLVMFENTH